MISSFGGFGAIKNLLYKNESADEKIIRIIAIVMVPIMLLSVPITKFIRIKIKAKA